jgi:hypothetical protein
MKNKEMLKIFLNRADVKGPDDCWNWLGPIDAKLGYGRSSFIGYSTSAHRTVWMLSNGEEPPKYAGTRRVLIRHICGNKLCVNPKHLALGNYSDNGKDASEEGKHVKMNILQLLQALELRKEGMTYRQIGKIIGESESVVSGAINGKRHCYRKMLQVLSKFV